MPLSAEKIDDLARELARADDRQALEDPWTMYTDKGKEPYRQMARRAEQWFVEQGGAGS